jgi:regulator of protease activity HflC (stomatin/prohibitin superfamily)
VRDLFGIEVFDLQIPAIRYSDTFVASVEAAVKAKDDAIAAENTVNRIRFEGEQKVVTARADRKPRLPAQAQKQSQILAAGELAALNFALRRKRRASALEATP